MRSLRYLNGVLTVLAVLLTLHLWTQWTASGQELALTPSAQADVPGMPNAAAQRKQMVDELKLMNQKLATLTELLQSGKARVQLVNPPAEGN